MLFKIERHKMQPLSGAFPLPYVPARVTRGALVARRHSFAIPRCRTFQYPRTFVSLPLLQCLFVTILMTICLKVWDWLVLRTDPMVS